MHYPNLTFHGVETIWFGFSVPHRCVYGLCKVTTLRAW